MSRLYRIVHYGVVPSMDGGYEVNDAHYTGQLVELPECDDDVQQHRQRLYDKQVLKQMQVAGYLHTYNVDQLLFDHEIDGAITITGIKPRKDDYFRPLFQLAPFDPELYVSGTGM